MQGKVMLDIKIDADTIFDGKLKLDSFSHLIEAISKEDACNGMTRLDIFAKMVAQNETAPKTEESANGN